MPVTRRAAALARTKAFDPHAFVQDVAGEVETRLARDGETLKRCRALLAHIYARQSAFAYGEDALSRQFAPVDGAAPLGPLTRLECGDEYDCEQLWEELEMRNQPVCEHLRSVVDKHVQQSVLDDAEGETVQIEVDPKRSAFVVGDDDDEEDEGQDEEGEEDEDEAEQPTGILKKPKINLRESDEEESEGEEPNTKSKRRVQFAEKDDEESTVGEERDEDVEQEKDEEEGDDKSEDDAEDGFFSWTDFEKVGEIADQLESQGRLVESDSEDEDDGDEDAPLYSEKPGEGNGENARYDDFFDPPTNEKMSEENARALRRAEMFDDPSDDPDVEKTPLELARERMRETIEAMENASVAKKPWQLRGEVLADSRPKNSVLDANFEHDTALTSRAAYAAASAETIETLIKQRVRDGLYDDPVRVLPREYREKKERKELPEVSQEKPTVGLGELYAEEFAAERERVSKAAEAANTVQKEEDEEENELQKEVTKACKALCRKLDALASLHFTPSMPEETEEMEVKPNVPALAAEEAIPEAVSDAQLLAPGEVHRASKKDRVGELEKVKRDRKRNRRAVKKRVRELTKERTTRVRNEEAGDPELAEKRRAERALERRGKKRLAPETAQAKGGHYSKSNRFFAGLQQEVEGEIAKKKAKKTSREDEGRTRSAAALKL